LAESTKAKYSQYEVYWVRKRVNPSKRVNPARNRPEASNQHMLQDASRVTDNQGGMEKE
jgi:hypothetical protein